MIASASQSKARSGASISACGAALLLLLAVAHTAQAVPSFAQQTGVPCAQCHVHAFGPALTEFGRQFKLHGYVLKADDGRLKIPLALTAVGGYSHTSKDQPHPPAPDFSTNDNWVVQTANLYLAGRLGEHIGVFALGTYDDTIRNAMWGNLDVRYARNLQIGGHAVVGGVSVNNNPTVEDVWNSTPVWGFPYVASELVPNPSAAPQIFGALGQSVLGASVYSLIDSRFYVALGLYRGLSRTWLGNLGIDASGSPELSGVVPYLRAAYQHQFPSDHYVEIGVLGMDVKQRPAGLDTSETDRYTDYGIDATYQFFSGVHGVDAHFIWVREDRDLDASFAANSSSAKSNHLDSTRLNASYAYRQTWIGSVGFFSVNGSSNRLLFPPAPGGGSASGSPNSRGYILQLEVVPFGKADSFARPWVNLRTGVQYIRYWRFNGGDSNYDGFGRAASDNNTVFVYAWLAL